MKFRLVEAQNLSEVLLARGESNKNVSSRHPAYAGIFFDPIEYYEDAKRHGSSSNNWGKYVLYKLTNSAKIYNSYTSCEFIEQHSNLLKLNKQDYDILDKLLDQYKNEFFEKDYMYYKNNKYIYNIKDLANLCIYYQLLPFTQYIVFAALNKLGYDGTHYMHEDDYDPEQYQIWNLNMVKKL